MKTKLLNIIRSASILIILSLSLHSYAEPILDYYEESGLSPNHDYLNQTYDEYIDPFNGSLKLNYEDIKLPGNGGFDLSVIRSYNSTLVASDKRFLDSTMGGLGWNIHFGRVLNKRTDICINVKNSIVDNPVLELADGSRQIFAFTGSSSSFLMTTQRWKADCSSGRLIVYSPEGLRYDMTQIVNQGTSVSPTYAWYVTKITDPNGNYANISYVNSTSQIDKVSTNDGRNISFTYADGSLPTRRITSITAEGKTYKYNYQSVSGYYQTYQLTSVTRPDGTTWKYNYNGDLGLNGGSYMVNKVTYPQGGSTSYQYSTAFFDPGIRTTVIAKKTASGGGTWSFSYTPGSIGKLDVTNVSTPKGTLTYRHIGANYASSGSVWMVGLLVGKVTGSVESEIYTWGKQKISSEDNSRPGDFVEKVDVGAVYAPVLTLKKITRDSATYSTEYLEMDGYGNPKKIVESGPNGGDRTTSLTYFINTAKWIINKVQNESYSGSSISRTFDSNGNLTQESVDGVSTKYSYDSQGNISSVTNPRGKKTSYSSYKRGTPESESKPLGINITRVVSNQGNVTSERNGDGLTTYYSYDDLDRTTSIRKPLGNATSINYGSSSKQSTRGSLVETTGYNGFGFVTSTSLGGIQINKSVDSSGRTTFESNPGSTSGTSFSYDALDRITRKTNPDGTTVSYSYGSSKISVNDERGMVTTYTYRAFGNPDEGLLIGVSYPDSTANIAIARNSKGLVTGLAQAGISRGYGYNANYFQISEVNPETGTTTYGRDSNGNMLSKSVGSSGLTTTYSYDDLDRLISVYYPGSTPSVSYTYNNRDLITSENSSTAVRSYSYDSNTNLVSEFLNIDGINYRTDYTYNVNDQLFSTTYPVSGQTINYSPDVLGRPTQVSGFVNGVSYWPSGQINSITYSNGVTSIYGQNNRLWPSSFATAKGSAYLINSSYGYDGTGNLTAISDSTDNSYNRVLGYDNINRLIQANGPWGTGTIAYNGSGNITKQTIGNIGSLNYSYDSQNRLSSISGRLSNTYRYDGYGNISSVNSNSFVYDGAPNLRCANCNSSQRADYSYDARNQRVLVNKAGLKKYEVYSSSGSKLIEYTPDQIDKLTEYFYLGGKRIAQRTSSNSAPIEVNYFHNDVSGSPLLATNTSGGLLWKENYQPYGDKLNNQTSSSTNNIGFAGKPYDDETGLSYMGARYYDPVIGRFTGVDPQGFDSDNVHSLNRYTYANNNPYRYVDPDGHSPIDVAFLVYDIGKLGRSVYTGVGVGGALADVASSVVGAASPIPGTGQAIKAARAVDKVADVGRVAKNAGRAGKQGRLKELANDPKLGSADRGWIKQEQNAIEKGKRKTIRNPPGKDLAHERGREASKGYGYEYSNLQDRDLHRLQHKYDNFGKKNSERPPQ